MPRQFRTFLILAGGALLLAVLTLTVSTYIRRRGPFPTESQATVASFDRVTMGMNKQQVASLLGDPSGELVGPFLRDFLPKSRCVHSGFSSVTHYYKYADSSFFVFWNSTGRVVCKERRWYQITGG
jgi:hypothetical protein